MVKLLEVSRDQGMSKVLDTRIRDLESYKVVTRLEFQ